MGCWFCFLPRAWSKRARSLDGTETSGSTPSNCSSGSCWQRPPWDMASMSCWQFSPCCTGNVISTIADPLAAWPHSAAACSAIRRSLIKINSRQLLGLHPAVGGHAAGQAVYHRAVVPHNSHGVWPDVQAVFSTPRLPHPAWPPLRGNRAADVGKNFLRSYAGVCLEGAVDCAGLHHFLSAMASSPRRLSITDVSAVHRCVERMWRSSFSICLSSSVLCKHERPDREGTDGAVIGNKQAMIEAVASFQQAWYNNHRIML